MGIKRGGGTRILNDHSKDCLVNKKKGGRVGGEDISFFSYLD